MHGSRSESCLSWSHSALRSLDPLAMTHRLLVARWLGLARCSGSLNLRLVPAWSHGCFQFPCRSSQEFLRFFDLHYALQIGHCWLRHPAGSLLGDDQQQLGTDHGGGARGGLGNQGYTQATKGGESTLSQTDNWTFSEHHVGTFPGALMHWLWSLNLRFQSSARIWLEGPRNVETIEFQKELYAITHGQ